MLLMIVDDLNFVSVALAPNKTKPPLVVDSDAVLSFSIAMQRFQTISRRRHQVSQFSSAVQLPKLPARVMFDRLKPSARQPVVKSPSIGGAERLNHVSNCISPNV